MIVFTEAQIVSVVLHRVGNKALEEGMVLSPSALEHRGNGLGPLLLRYFLSSFSENEMYRFHHHVSLHANTAYKLCGALFDNPADLVTISHSLANHLYESSDHPKIKGGDFYVAYLNDVVVDGQKMDAIGMFKAETKEGYFKVEGKEGGLSLAYDEGASASKPDKGCLVLLHEGELGYRACVIDNLNKASGAMYWKETFLGLEPMRNAFHQTQEVLGMAKTFVNNRLPEEFKVAKADQIDLLNRSVEYFSTHETFDKNEFEATVLHQPELIESFRKFDEDYRGGQGGGPEAEFPISMDAVKKQARSFKSVIKLDKNFHIYVHGDRTQLEQGVDETTGRKFYKLYYLDES